MRYKIIYPAPIKTCIVRAEDVPGIRPGDSLGNSASTAGYTVVVDGGIDFRDLRSCVGRAAERHIKAGRFLIESDGNYYRYVKRKEGTDA